MKALGIEGDTPRDTVATLVAQVKQLRTELQTALNDNKNQKAENERLRAGKRDRPAHPVRARRRARPPAAGPRAVGQRPPADPGPAAGSAAAPGRPSGKSGQADLPVGLGLEEGDGKRAATRAAVRATPVARLGRAGRCRLVDAKNGSSGSRTSPDQLRAAQKTLSDGRRVASTVADVGQPRRGRVEAGHRAVELDADGSIAMTALIGRVPIDGTVNDPPSFKVLIGPDNLTANGIDIP